MGTRHDKALFLADALNALGQLLDNELEAPKSIFWAKLMRSMQQARAELNNNVGRTVRVVVRNNAELMMQLGKKEA